MNAPQPLPDQARSQVRGALRWLAAACMVGMLAWAVAQSQASSAIGSFLEIQGQVVAPANSPTLNSTLDVSGGDTVRWTHFMSSRLENPFEAEGVQTFPADVTWVRGSLRKPASVSAQWQVNGQWVDAEPAEGAAVTAVRWRQRPMYEATYTTATSAVDFQGTGDGYRVIPYKDKLFVVNHLGGGDYLNCRMAGTGLACPGFESRGMSFVSTPGQALTRGANGLWYPTGINLEAVNYKTGELFMYMNNLSQPAAHLLCTNLDTLTSCGEWRMSQINLSGTFEAVGNRYFMLDSSGALICFDIATKTNCGTTKYSAPAATLLPSAALDGKLFFSNHTRMYCHDAEAGRPCSGWTTSGLSAAGYNIFGVLNADGSLKGVCTQSENCLTVDGQSMVMPRAFAEHVQTFSPKRWPNWSAGHAYIGTKIYTPSETGIGCFDFATTASCGSYSGSAYMAVYNARTDPTRPGCIMALGDYAIATIIDGNTWKACSSGVTGVLPDLEVNPQDFYACDASRSRVTGWREVRISNSIAWGGANGLSGVTVTLKDERGQVLPAALNPVRTFAKDSYNLSIADIPYSLYPKLTIGLKMESSGTFPKVAFGADVTWDGDPQQVCVSTKIAAQPNCQLDTTLAVDTKVIGQATSTPAETLSVATVLSPGGLSSGYSAVATPTSPRAVLSDLGSRDPKTYVVQGRWALQHFSGDLWAFGLGPNGQIDGSSYLSAQAATAAPSARPMFAATPGAGVQPVKSLEWASLSAGQQSALNLDLGGVADTKGSARLDYLRGTDGSFRARSGKSLGPVISSSPAMLLPAATLSLDERSHPGYTAYRATVTRPHPIALFGGNDGALHAYEVRPGSLKEAWSFVPDAMLRRAANYADPSIAGIRANPYFVDNIPMVGHANTTGETDGWRAVAVVTYGRGARAITALDVTRSDLSRGDGVLFEYSNTSDPELKDLGYIISQPVSNNAMVSQQIVQLGKDSERRAAVLVGNGINSNDGDGGAAASGTGKAVLYAFYLDRGEQRWRRWAVDELWAGADSEPALKTHNGLSMPTPVDVDGDGRIDLVYAGDLQGNLWRFDIRDPAAARVTRLFKTEAEQPITQAPYVSVNTQATGCGSTEPQAASSAKRCWQVVFATGAAISPLIGSPNVATQSIYGVLDKGRGASLVRGHLTAIPFEVNSILRGVEYRALKPTTVDYKGGSLGWAIDLQAFEHGVGAPRQQPTGLVMFSSIRPTTPDRAINVCIGPRSWLNEVDPLNGYSALVPFDTNGDGNIDGQDRINPDSSTPLSPAGMAVSGAQFGPPAILLAASTQAQQMSLLLPSLGQDTGQANSWSGGVPPGGSATPGQNSTALTHANKAKLGRMSWREVY